MSTEEKKRTKAILVFIRECDTGDGKKGRLFFHAMHDEWEEQTADYDDKDRYKVFSKKVAKTLHSGQACEIDMSEDGETVFLGTNRYLGLWPDDAKRAQWNAESRAYHAMKEMGKRISTDKKNDAFKSLCEPLRTLYRKLPYQYRESFLAAITYEVTR